MDQRCLQHSKHLLVLIQMERRGAHDNARGGGEKTKMAKALWPALLVAQGSIGNRVAKTGNNPMVKNTFPTLCSVLELVSPALTEAGLVLHQSVSSSGETQEMVTSLIHASTGERVESTVPLVFSPPRKGNVNDSQMMGSAITYARRYGIMAALNLVGADDDDDGCAGRRPPRRSSPPRPRRPEQPEQRGPAGARGGSQSDLAARLFGVLTGCNPSNTPTAELDEFEAAVGRSGTMRRLASVGVETAEDAREMILERARAAFAAASDAGNLSDELKARAADALQPPDGFGFQDGIAATDALCAAALADDGGA